MRIVQLLLCFLIVLVHTGCNEQAERNSLLAQQTVMELRVVKGQPRIVVSGHDTRAPYPRERLAVGAHVTQDGDALAFLRTDSGATMLLSGSADITVESEGLTLARGRLFVDTQGGSAVELHTSRGTIETAEGRSSVTLDEQGNVEIYVLRGTARHDTTRARAGERIRISKERKATLERTTAWDDWTLGLATADPEAQPAPFGIGTVGARAPADQGKPRFPLVIQRLSVRVTINQDFATTEVDETFLNPSENTVEGLYGFRVPPNAVLNRFGVDRDGLLVWGQIKEKSQAKAQYESHVYAGSTEDPALLEWVQRGVYQARLYPILAGSTRRLVTRYSEWLGRHGAKGERRLYVYPMAATGAEGTLPRIEEMTLSVDYSKASATSIRAPRGAILRDQEVLLKAHDFTPKADVFLELYDAGNQQLVAYRAPHVLGKNDIAKEVEPSYAKRVATEEQDYLLLSLPTTKSVAVEPGLDLAIVVDSSAATDSRALSLGRHLVASLLNALGPNDRAALFTGDTGLNPVLPESSRLMPVDEARRKAYLAALANVPLGGATDLGSLLASAAERLDSKRRSAVVYVGDGRPSVGEMLSKTLRERLDRLPPTMRILAAGTGPEVNTPLLESLVRGGPLELIGNSYEAALSSLRLLEAANGDSWQGSSVELAGLERLLPKQVPTVAAGQPALVVGRVSGKLGSSVTLSLGGKTQRFAIRVVPLEDDGDLRRRWGEGRLLELSEQQSGRLARVDLARRYGLVTPLTSLYVATRAEVEKKDQENSHFFGDDAQTVQARRSRWRPWTLFHLDAQLGLSSEVADKTNPTLPAASTNNKEGGTGTRAKGEEGSMERAAANAKSNAWNAPTDFASREAALKEAQEFGITGLSSTGTSEKSQARSMKATNRRYAVVPMKPIGGFSTNDTESKDEAPTTASEEATSGVVASASIVKGSGQGRLGGSHATVAGKLRIAPIHILGTFDETVASRTLRQHYGAFRQCYEAGLARNPNLEGKLTLALVISESGSVSRATRLESNLADSEVVSCVMRSVYAIGFPPPNQGRVTLTVPILFGNVTVPQQAPAPPLSPTPKQLVVDTHQPPPCSKAADLPLPERRKLWTERLAATSDAVSVVQLYRAAITQCEATSFFERQLLLYAMVDRLPSVVERVNLYRLLLDRPTAAVVVYRAILGRIQDADGMKQLHVALGIRQLDEVLLKQLLERVRSKEQAVTVLRELVQKWPEDLELGLKLLYALEDANDHAAARAYAQKLRKRGDTTLHVRTAVGEFYLRQAARDSDRKAHDETEARRCFGEIVEFATEDPVARRSLGDLLLAHGWYEEAFRQYQTLKLLTPEDPTVELRLAEAAYGMGKVEEALRWTEKARATASPDGQTDLERASQAWASAYVAWAHRQAVQEGHADVASRLMLRGQRLRSGEIDLGTKYILTWAHPELQPTLWFITSGGEQPARNMTLLGVAEGNARDASALEIRIAPEDTETLNRLGAVVTLTAITNEGTNEQKTVTKQLRFNSVTAQRPTLRVKVEGDALVEEVL